MADEPHIRIDTESRRTWCGGKPVHLSAKEFNVLHLLALNEGKVVTREQIMAEVWDTNWWGSTKTLDMHISWLRRKFRDDAANPRYITTVRGVGFRLEPGTVDLEGGVEPLSGSVVDDIRRLCEQALAGVQAGWAPAEVGGFASSVLAVLDVGPADD